MAASLVSTFTVRLSSARTPDSGVYSGKPQTYADAWTVRLTSGTGAADVADLRYVARLTFAASTAQTIDLSSCTGDDGVSCAFARVREMGVRLLGTVDAMSLTIDNNGATTPFTGFLNATGQLQIYPSTGNAAGTAIGNSGYTLLAAPNTTGAAVGSGVHVRLLPSAHAFQADLVIVGCST